MKISEATTVELLRAAYKYAHENSDDPVTQIGAILGNYRGYIFTSSANHFPDGVDYLPERLERPAKYAFMEHAERGAIYLAARKGIPTVNKVLFAPWSACTDCARAIVESGIQAVVGHQDARDRSPERWLESVALGDQILKEGGVELILHNGRLGDCLNVMNGEIWEP